MIKPYQHQQKIWDENRLWTGIFQGTGSAKTISSLGLAEGSTLVVCDKQGRDIRTFENNRDRLDKVINMTVMSKEDFKKAEQADAIPYFDTLIIDEADNFFGVLPDTRQENYVEIPKTSQFYDSLLRYVKKYKPKRFYLLTATPASKPMHVFAIATLLGHAWDYFKFRRTFYFEHKKGYKKFWLPKRTKILQQRLADYVKMLGYTGKLEDFFDVPEQTHRTVYVELTDQQKEKILEINRTVADPMAKRSMLRTVENGVLYGKEIINVSEKKDRMVKNTTHFHSEKIDHIVKLAEEFPKMLVFSAFLGQVDAIALALTAKGYKVFTLTGASKNRKKMLEIAEQSEACIIVASATISAGYEWKSCPTVVFASKSNRYRNYEQGLGRVQRSDAIKKNLYINLVVKNSMDEVCHDTIMAGADFQELVMD